MRCPVLITLAVLAGCEYPATPKHAGVYRCTVNGQVIQFDSRDYDWRANAERLIGHSKKGGPDIRLASGPGDCTRVAL